MSDLNGQPDYEARERLRAIRLREKIAERKQWAEYQRTYERCKLIAETVWQKELDDASAQQQALAEAMRDRRYVGRTVAGFDYTGTEAAIPVPLFTPRDRIEFLGRVTTNLMIGTEKRGLTVTPEVKSEADAAPTSDVAPVQEVVEAASGTDETQSDATQYGEPREEGVLPRVSISETPASAV